MKNPKLTTRLLALLLVPLIILSTAPPLLAAVTGRTEDSSVGGTEKILSDSSGADTYILVSSLRNAPALTGGLTASGSSSWDFSGSTGTFKTSTGIATFGGSANNFSNVIQPTSNDGAALGASGTAWADLFLASGAVINWNAGNVALTHTSGVLTLGTGNLIITTAGTATGSVVTNNGSQSLSGKTLVAPVISTGLTASGSASNDFSSSTGTFKTSTGVNTFGGSTHTFAGDAKPATDGTGNLGTAALSWDNLYLDTLATINFDNGNSVITHSSGILTVSTGDLRVTTAGTNTASVATVGGTQTLAAKTLTSPVIATGLTASGSAANTFAGSTGTFITSTGANTFKGSAHNFDAVLQPTTNDAAALGTTTLGFADLFLATGGTLHFADTDWVATHTTGILTVGTGDLRVTTAGTNAASVVTVGGTQTLTAKTLTSPTITGPTITGNSTTSGTVIQTSASAAAFSSGLNGDTNPVFRLVNNIASQATGISITGRAAAAGADITVLSSGTDENLVINAKGAGTISLNPTGTGNIVLSRAATGVSLAVTGALTTSSSSAAFGYASGAGGAVTQITSRNTGVTLSKTTGQITTDTTSLAAGAEAEFTVTNTLVEATDTVVVNITPGGTGAPMAYVSTVAAGSFKITITNLHASTADTSADVINFTIIKGKSS